MSNVSFHVGPGIIRRSRESASGEKARVKLSLSCRPRNYPLGEKERVDRDWLRRPRYYPSGAALNTKAFVASAQELSVGGEGARRPCLVARSRVGRVCFSSEGARRTGLVALTPGLSVEGWVLLDN